MYINKYGLCPYICNHENNVPSRLSPQWLCGDNQEGTLFSRLHVYYAHLAFVRFEHYVSWITYDHLYIYIYIYLSIYLSEAYQQKPIVITQCFMGLQMALRYNIYVLKTIIHLKIDCNI